MLRPIVLASLLAFGALTLAHAQTSGGVAPLKLVVPFPPGDGLESAARVLAELVGKELNTTVVVENRVGASGAVAAEAVARANDPRMLLVGTTALMGITPYIRSVPYSPADFEPIARFAHISAVIAIRNEIPAKDWAEFVALAKAAPKKFTYATPGEGTLTHLSVEALSRNAGIEMLAVPYKGMAPALQDFLGGRLDFYTEPAVVPSVKAGKARALAVNSNKRLPELPDVPTYNEAGIRAATTPWIGILTTKAMPADQKQQVAAAVKRAVESPEFTSKLPTGIESAYSPSADFAKQIQSEQAYYKDLIKTLNLKVE
jgi:tripartite-type tricarboxylate transporter receptor subunit TctC